MCVPSHAMVCAHITHPHSQQSILLNAPMYIAHLVTSVYIGIYNV